MLDSGNGAIPHKVVKEGWEMTDSCGILALAWPEGDRCR